MHAPQLDYLIDHAELRAHVRRGVASEAKYLQALALEPQNRRALTCYGSLLLALKRYDEALPLFEKILKRHPDDAMTWLNMGNIYGAQRDFIRARDCYGKAYAFNPNGYEIAGSYIYTMSFICDWREHDKVLATIEADTKSLVSTIEDLEFRRMFSQEADPCSAFLDIQAGAGGTEACDWASMLLRQYLKYAERKGFKTTVEDESAGDVAGIKGATIKIEGEYAFGLLRTETGVHRLVRKSPFDSSGGRHTSFASVFVYPEIDDSIEIDINPADVRTDTFRASGAGGQHINKTDSAVRLTHIPTGIVVQCQDGRSQHSNKDVAWKRLRSRLYDFEMRKRQEAQQKLEDTKTDVGWGHQIRSYVLDNSRIKDLRTNVEISNTQKVLDGDLDAFIEASLKQGV
jgi:peptide chain release factor 2